MKKWYECSMKEKLDRWVNAERVLRDMPNHDRVKHWEMAHWGISTECGTIGCAAGHCGLDPWFRKRGLKLKPVTLKELIDENIYLDEGDKVPETYEELLIASPDDGIKPGQGEFENGVDVCDFFGDESNDIFGNPDSRSVNDVIDEIREHINELQQDFDQAKSNLDDEIKDAREQAASNLKDELDAIQESYLSELREIG